MRIPFAAYSRAALFVSPITPCLNPDRCRAGARPYRCSIPTARGGTEIPPPSFYLAADATLRGHRTARHHFQTADFARLAHSVKCLRIWLAMSSAPQRHPPCIRGPGGRPRLINDGSVIVQKSLVGSGAP